MIKLDPNFLVLYGLLFMNATINIVYNTCVIRELEDDSLLWIKSYLQSRHISYNEKYYSSYIEFNYNLFSPIEKHLIIWLTNASDYSNVHPILFKLNTTYYFILGCIMNTLHLNNEDDSFTIINNKYTIRDLKLLFDTHNINYILKSDTQINIIVKK